MSKSTSIPVHEFGEHAKHSIAVEFIKKRSQSVSNEVHRHGFFEVFLFETGSGTHMVDLEQYPIKTPGIHIVSPGMVHQLTRSADCTGSVVMFKADLDLGLLNTAKKELFRPGHPIACSVSNAQLAKLKLLVSELITEQKSDSWRTAASFLGILLNNCLNAFSVNTSNSKKAEHAVNQFQRLLEKHYLVNHSISFYADLLRVTPGHLNALVKKQLGITSGTLIENRRILEAKRLLLHSDESVKEIAYQLCFEDPSYFARVFKRATSLTPSAFRTKIRKKYP